MCIILMNSYIRLDPILQMYCSNCCVNIHDFAYAAYRDKRLVEARPYVNHSPMLLHIIFTVANLSYNFHILPFRLEFELIHIQVR